MHRLPKKTSLIAETAATLKQWIADGEMGQTLPGELRLKALLGVGRNTLRLALKILEDEHYISSPGQGRQRRVEQSHSAPRTTASRRQLPVTFLSPYPMVDRITLLEMEDLRKHLAGQGRELRFVTAGAVIQKRPEQHLQRMLRENPSAAWILSYVSEATQRWFQKQELPAFIYGSAFPGVDLPFIVNDWESAAFHAGIQLTRQGHRVIAQISYEQMMPGMLAVERGLRRALATVNAADRLLMLKTGHPPESVFQSLETTFNQPTRPTALVFCSSCQLVTCYSWLTSKGIAVPADLSLVSIPSDSWFDDLYPPVCHYENNLNTFAHHVRQKVMELVETGCVVRKSIRVRLEYKAGATIGAVPHVQE
jgi:DNA-binding LacI/PurR family transcriptional regulator